MTSVDIRIGDCRTLLAAMNDQSVNCCVTSPPYFGLRDYGTAKWEGGDAACDHVAKRKPPTVGSSSTLGFPADGGPRRIGDGNTYHEAYTEQYRDVCGKCGAKRVDNQIGLEQTPEEYVAEMVAVFREVRRVLRDDGTLWLNLGDSYASSTKGTGGDGSKSRLGTNKDLQNIQFQKMESRKFDCGLAAKQLIGIPWRVAFALQSDGWYLRQDIIWHKPNPMPESVRDRCTKAHEYIFMLSKSARYYWDADAIKEPGVYPAGTKGAKGSAERQSQKGVNARPPEYKIYDGMRNRRSVWTVTTKPFKGAHFATFPPDLIEPCILAGCSTGGTVLDPFGGAGTTGLVAKQNGRNAILLELNPEYAAMARERIDNPPAAKRKRAANDNAPDLFDAA